MNITLRMSTLLRDHRNLVLFGAALLSGGLALYAGHRYVSTRLDDERARNAPVEQVMVDVIVAARNLDKGDLVDESAVAVRSMPAAYVNTDAVQAERFSTLAGGRLMTHVRTGEPILASLVLGAESTTFSQRLRSGVRALTLPVDEVNAIAGMLQPGDHVDLYYSAVLPGARNAFGLESTTPMFQNLLVLATGQQLRAMAGEAGDQSRGFSHVTVEVTPDQAQRIVIARQSGRLTATLRHPDDNAELAPHAMDARHLLGFVERPAPTTRRGPSLQVIVGGLGGPPALDTRAVPGGSMMPAPQAKMLQPMQPTLQVQPTQPQPAQPQPTQPQPAPSVQSTPQIPSSPAPFASPMPAGFSGDGTAIAQQRAWR